jgi:hypothetical protein
MAALAACFALAALASAALAPQAMANREDCPGQYVCLWNGPTFGEERVQFHDNGLQSLVPWGFNDRASSAYNNTNRWARIWDNSNGTGTSACIPPGVSEQWSGTGFNNIASAIQIEVTTLGCG